MQYIPEMIVNVKITVELVHMEGLEFGLWPFDLIHSPLKMWHFSANFCNICTF